LRDLLEFLKDYHVARRTEVPEQYWDALVRGEMAQVDPYWRIIRDVMDKLNDHELIVEFVMLTTHYMDSRFLNDDRTKFIKAAVAQLEKMEKSDQTRKQRALLKIDALAWTYIEEGEPTRAESEIRQGLELLDKDANGLDIEALAACWTARIECLNGNWLTADGYLARAEALSRKLQDKPWIQMRVEMMAGDFLKMKGKPDDALERYENAENLAECYGGEGDGYQTSPRIGFAFLDLESDPKAEDKAEQRFRKLIDNRQVSIGHLYGRYGIALIAARKNSTREAVTQLQMIRQEIDQRGSGNILLKMTQDLYERIRGQAGYAT
jgi:predicted negative regulator of RcsB-dependent stress response